VRGEPHRSNVARVTLPRADLGAAYRAACSRLPTIGTVA
jgi:hypothetical protein